jgi:uncharacterized radical SAM protein YgiQ
MAQGFLPVNIEEVMAAGHDAPDFVFVTGDAYVDHPSFAHALIGRVVEAAGYSVMIAAQPEFRTDEAFKALPRPKLAFLICGGNMDTMVNHYTVAKKRRPSDFYSPGGKTGLRPDRATIVYGKMLRRCFPDVPIVIGGIEASLRRLGHYDYWSDKVMRSILIDSCADLLIYGMGERQIREIADLLASGKPVNEITNVRGTVYKSKKLPEDVETVLPSFMEIASDKRRYAESFAVQYDNTDPFRGKKLAEPYENCFIVQNPPALPLTQAGLDAVYELPYAGAYHPSYEKDGGVPAASEISFSITSSRGCFGGCNFCALTFHQGRIVQARSHESIMREAEKLVRRPDFKGFIHDVGGPTANFRAPACEKQLTRGACSGKQCLFPKPCSQLKADHSDYISLLRKLRRVPGVKKVFIRSGIRFDYLLADPECEAVLEELARNHISGQLKVAPEHISDNVLKYMGKPEHGVYEEFDRLYRSVTEKSGKKLFTVPYLMSSHPGSTLKDAVALAEYLRDRRIRPEQVQDFYPTPSTVSTCMYYTGIDPRTMEPVYTASSPHEKALQRALIQYSRPENYKLVKEALITAGRRDLIGNSGKCLIKPYERNIKK